jgi:2-polyprenyl-3-methyl-5-hydroxy-6-metoxy-1,4-benzoquinol methylase
MKASSALDITQKELDEFKRLLQETQERYDKILHVLNDLWSLRIQQKLATERMDELMGWPNKDERGESS